MQLINTNIGQYLPRDLRVVGWESIKDDEEKIHTLAFSIAQTTIEIACAYTGQPELDEEHNNPYDDERDELVLQVIDLLKLHNTHGATTKNLNVYVDELDLEFVITVPSSVTNETVEEKVREYLEGEQDISIEEYLSEEISGYEFVFWDTIEIYKKKK